MTAAGARAGRPRSVFHLADNARDPGHVRREATALYERRAGPGGRVRRTPPRSRRRPGPAGGDDGRPARSHGRVRAPGCPARPVSTPSDEPASRLRPQSRYRTAYTLLGAVVGRVLPGDPAFTAWAHRWGLLLGFPFRAYRVGDHQAAVRACGTLLATPDLPDAVGRRAEADREVCAPHVEAVPGGRFVTPSEGVVGARAGAAPQKQSWAVLA
ncbi:hypothetical protein [Streptomyces rishiriensis]|uniref:Uncharacterized protein n=1 Tax=Streptomyces rishiriensis TaxID=68264 RepID=A0ABU0NPW8_STRRH|nr:hypothetical protein [Streptomyces rishiriensis]MDQ0581009.1 hypothetical protein [Streptomyces rishiriensis]